MMIFLRKSAASLCKKKAFLRKKAAFLCKKTAFLRGPVFYAIIRQLPEITVTMRDVSKIQNNT